MEETRKQTKRVFRAVSAWQRSEQAEAVLQSIPAEDGLVTMYRTHLFCGLVYVAWEAYRNLGWPPLEELDEIATPDFVDRLRRFRNVWFHDQESMFDKRYLAFFEPEVDGLRKTLELHRTLRVAFEVFLEHEKWLAVISQQVEEVPLEAFEEIVDEQWNSLPDWFKNRLEHDDE